MPSAGTLAARLNPVNLVDTQQVKYDYATYSPGNPRITAMPIALAPYIIGKAGAGDSRANAETYLQQFGPLQDAFTCPSDELTASRQYNTSPWVETDQGNITSWTSYGYNAEIIAPERRRSAASSLLRKPQPRSPSHRNHADDGCPDRRLQRKA